MMYSLSYLHYSTLAVIVSIIVGLVVSGITGITNRVKGNKYTSRGNYFDVEKFTSLTLGRVLLMERIGPFKCWPHFCKVSDA